MSRHLPSSSPARPASTLRPLPARTDTPRGDSLCSTRYSRRTFYGLRRPQTPAKPYTWVFLSIMDYKYDPPPPPPPPGSAPAARTPLAPLGVDNSRGPSLVLVHREMECSSPTSPLPSRSQFHPSLKP